MASDTSTSATTNSPPLQNHLDGAQETESKHGHRELEKYVFFRKAKDDEYGHPHYPHEDALPYGPRKVQLGRGASGIVYRVTVMKRYLKTDTDYNAKSVPVVRKEFEGPKALLNFMDENRFLKDLSEREQQPPDSIMSAILSYAVGTPQVYNIVFEPAECSLNTYLSSDDNFPDETAAERLKNVSRMIGVARGLKWISSSFEFEAKSGYYQEATSLHRDLRPENILVCKNKHPSGSSGEFIFKLSDFGRALKRSTASETSDPSSKSTEPQELKMIRGTYAAPEDKVTEKSDVWSLGCVLLNVVTFNYEGVAGLNEFMASLIRESNVDNFYDRKSQKANDKTYNCMRHLNGRSETGSDKLVTRELLSLLEKQILVPEKRRADVGDVEEAMKNAYNRKNLITPSIQDRTHPALKNGVRHCAQSPNGEFEMFHLPGDNYGLMVYHADLSTPLPILEPMSAPKDEPKVSKRIYPRCDSCSTEKICQVISNKAPIELSVYTVSSRPGVSPRRLFVSLTDIPSVFRVALSPDSLQMAMDCVLANDESLSVLRLFKIEELAKQMSKVREMPSGDAFPDGISPKGVSGTRKKWDLLFEHSKARSKDMNSEALCFSGDSRRLYHVTQMRSDEHEGSLDFVLRVAIWDTKRLEEPTHVLLNKQNLDSDEFLTCFAPFGKKLGFIAITCRRYITRYESSPDQHRKVDRAKVEPIRLGEAADEVLKTVIIAPDDSFAVFLGGKNRLTIYISKRKESWKLRRLNVENDGKFDFDLAHDAACITRDKNLRISYSNRRTGKDTLIFNLD